MGYFDSEENVDAYIAMADGYDGADLSYVSEIGESPRLDHIRQ